MVRTYLRLALFAVAALALTHCVTPMAPSEIDALTTCPKGVDLARVKKNLLLAGYGIEHASDDELITDYKQGSGRRWERITALKMDDLIKFKMRIRAESYESAPSGTTTTSYSSGSSRKSQKTYTTEETRTERVTNDSDQSYYVEYRPEYEKTKMEVCGRL